MEMYEDIDIDKETMELLLRSLAKRTLSGKQKWEGLTYMPISFMRRNEDAEDDTFISQMFEMETELNGRRYSLEVMEQVCFPSGKGAIFGTITCDGDEWKKYDLDLVFDERYGENDAEDLKEVFVDSAVVRFMDAALSVFEGTEAESRGFSYARYFNQTGIEPEWKGMPLVKLGKKLMDEKRMRDFHRIVIDMDYRKEMLEEVE